MGLYRSGVGGRGVAKTRRRQRPRAQVCEGRASGSGERENEGVSKARRRGRWRPRGPEASRGRQRGGERAGWVRSAQGAELTSESPKFFPVWSL